MNKFSTNPSVVFFGTPEFAAAQLEALLEAKILVKAVVTAPDKPAGRGKKLQQSAVKSLAIEKGLKILQPLNLKDQTFLKLLEELNADLFVVVAFRMLPVEVWKMPPLGTFNLHASLLPQYRGAAPINRAIMNGETETGLTTFLLNDKIDEGSIILQHRMPIAADENAGSLHDRMKEAGKVLVVKTVFGLADGSLTTTPQAKISASQLKLAPKIFKADCVIDWSKSLSEVNNQIRGLSPYPAAFTTLINMVSGQQVLIKIYQAEILREAHAGENYLLHTDNKSYLKVSHPEGFLALKEIQLPDRRAMKIHDFLNGFKLEGIWKVAL
jgi:methionyl-tRNA formyltransferase